MTSSLLPGHSPHLLRTSPKEQRFVPFQSWLLSWHRGRIADCDLSYSQTMESSFRMQSFRRLVAILVTSCLLVVTYIHGKSSQGNAPSNLPQSLPVMEAQTEVQQPRNLARAMSGAVAFVVSSPQAQTLQAMVLEHPIVLELGAVVLCQTVALPVIGKLSLILRHFDATRRMAFLHRHLHLSAVALRTSLLALRSTAQGVSLAALKSSQLLVRKSTRTWGTLAAYYKKTAASKYVNRGKRVIKEIQHHDDKQEDDEHHTA